MKANLIKPTDMLMREINKYEKENFKRPEKIVLQREFFRSLISDVAIYRHITPPDEGPVTEGNPGKFHGIPMQVECEPAPQIAFK